MGSRPAMWISLALTSFILFTWPFLSNFEEWPPLSLYIYLFAAWLGAIVVIALIAASLGPAAKPPDRKARD